MAIYMFLRHLSAEGQANRTHIASQNEMLISFYKEMHRDHISRAEESNRTVAQLVAVTEKNISATSRNTYVLEAIAKSVEHAMASMTKLIEQTQPQK